MSNWLSAAVEQAQALGEQMPAWRQASLPLLQGARWPTRKTEAWKYLPVNVWEQIKLDAPANPTPQLQAIEGVDSIDLVFVDGRLQNLPASLPAGLTITTFADADSQQAIAELFGQIKPGRHVFGLANDLLATDGLLVQVAAGAAIEQPLRIVNLVSAGEEAHTRVLVRVGAGARVSVIEESLGQGPSRNTAYAEYLLEESASLEHYRFALQGSAAVNVGGAHFKLQQQAQLNSTLVGFGSQLSRLDVDVIHAGEQANAKLNAIYLLDGKELFDLHSTIEHAVPNCTTEENVRGIVADNSRAVFNGRIHIHRNAQKTLAELNNRNLLMSDRAEIDTKPELEIYADDVRCAHGATVAAIDKKALYYMQSRGISRSQAQVMLSFGFINELVEEMPNEALADWLRPQLRERFAAMEVK
ncbi:Fe-S cluster assembly protein SufD [Pseudomaricurvus sp. HS19]|uniref:Fe-S cluster assembly protein SufD n=1 Tax=Pseudomaricurvus sp. HS19 TaxID=2692626 RepID=UPI001367F1F9|nr:Fe-S cluster assembly protein SufD [Pseudomaricurvus sp. HS19]MYM63005.1 Fe-S cluster assembly protein SufD [Pseudomaricurvus sp. HS19]